MIIFYHDVSQNMRENEFALTNGKGFLAQLFYEDPHP